ncbi:5-oxoprolinase subunit PxpB [Neobacillus niacini]|uniref:5-oxoprolinase subunit PxpB n=1 Tax=Neobacillus niacini TaxID=86668 RepID=UPI0039833485
MNNSCDKQVMLMGVEIVPLGDSAITISFGNKIDVKIHEQIHQFLHVFRNLNVTGVVECVPAYTTISIFYDPKKITYSQIEKIICSTFQDAQEVPEIESFVYQIPVYYGGETGPDLGFVADYNNMSEQEVINLHANKEYLIHMIGFVPGFPYLGGLTDKITAPRLERPRSKIPAGSVGIGGIQTGIYPREVPSGWRIIGITPLRLFDIENEKPSLLSAGDHVTFLPVDYEEFINIKKRAAAKKYEIMTYKKGGNGYD